ncbi:MAG: secretin N-terminal domain-containing protein [Burkholderiaceae bacterium]
MTAAFAWIPTARAQDIEIIPLRHRTAEQVLPTLRAFLEPGGALTGQGYQLLLRASPANVRQLKQLLATLDRAPRELMITVRQDRAGESGERSVGADGSVTIMNRRVYGNVSVEASDARTAGTQSAEQRIRVVEGGRAYVAIGTAIPMSFRQFVVTPQGLTEVRGTVYYDAVTGFYAQPQIAGDLVTVEIAPEQSEIVAGAVERAQLATTVRGRLGEWIAVGGADVRGESQTSGVLASEQRTLTRQRGVWLKVEEVGATPSR